MTSWLGDRRWAWEALHALSARDASRLRAVFDQSSAQVNETVLECPGGAPFDFAGEGFFDSRAQKWATPLFDRAIGGDTLLHLALRHHDPYCARVLVEAGANLTVSNVAKETPISMIWSMRGHDEDGWKSLVELLSTPLQQFQQNNRDLAKAGLVALYTTHAPERIAKIELQLNEYHGKELELLEKMLAKYKN